MHAATAPALPGPALLCGGPAADPSWRSAPPAVPGSVPSARRAFGGWLRERELAPDVADDAVLLFSELITNAVTHAPGGPGAELVCAAGLTADGTLQLEVHDHAVVALPRVRPGFTDDCTGTDESGRGLFIVAELALRWGVMRSPFTSGNAVWAHCRGR